MFKIHKPQMSGSIHSGHFMVSRLDEDEDDNNDPGDDSSESERDNANSVEIDVNNPESVVDASNMDLAYRVESPSNKNEHLTSWNDLDRPAKHSQKQQYLTYYTNSSSSFNATNHTDEANRAKQGSTSSRNVQINQIEEDNGPLALNRTVLANRFLMPGHDLTATTSDAFLMQANKELLARGFTDQHQHQYNPQQHVHQDHTLQHAQDNLHQLNALRYSQSSTKHMQLTHGHAHVTIDTSLTKLLECMQLYYSSSLTSPKWKSFKGLKLRLKYKIRLNNLIWRAWFLQCIRGRRPPGCQFTAPIETDVHKKSETIVLEGKYWKRKEKAIVDEYKKWRIFHKQKSQLHCFRPSSFDWDSRVSNLASSSLYGPECHFYPDYDMNNYNLDDLPPMLEGLDPREPESYYPPPLQPQSSTRMIEPTMPQQQQHQHHQQQQQQQQQHQPHQQHQQTNLLPQAPTPNQQQQQQHHLSIQHQQLAQVQVPRSNNSHHEAISLKTERTSLMTSNESHLQSQQSAIQTNFSQQIPQSGQSMQPHQRITNSMTSFNLGGGPLYQQISELQQQQQEQQEQQPDLNLHNSSQIQHQQPPDQDDLSMNQDMCSMSEGSYSGSGRNEQRRVCHINAEQKRRCNIKNGFDTLRSILPSINQNVNVKISKASMLQKAAIHISALSAEQKQQADEQAMLKQQIENLKQTIRAYQCQLPAAGGAVGCPGSSQAREMLQDYIKRRTFENWKFWIFSLLIEPLFETYYSSVSTNSLEDACKTIFTWLDRSCGLISLRKDALESLTFLSTSTNILNTPQTLPTEAVDAVRYHSAPARGPNNLHVAITAAGMPTTTSRQQQQQQQHPQSQPQQLQLMQPHQQAQQQPPATIPAHPLRMIW